MQELYNFNIDEIEGGSFDEFKTRAIEESEDSTCSVVPPQDIVAFNEQRSCADIFRMYATNQLDINPDFQRGEVWSNKAQTLFIDSLIKQLPIPSMCISLDIITQKRLVIDGLQRITSIIKFLQDKPDWKLSNTNDVDERLSGKKVSTIKREHSDLFNILENVTIPITVLRCNYNDKSHMEYLFQIFHRLNSGGNKLYNQEIRNCIFQGNFNNLLKKLARSDYWLQFADTSVAKVDKARFNNEERILRFFAFDDDYQNYKGKLAMFLNEFMNSHKQLSEEEENAYESRFIKTLNIANKLGKKVSSKNVADALLVGIAQNENYLSDKSEAFLLERYQELMKSQEYSEESLKEGLGSTDKVKARIDLAIKIFAK